MQMCRAVRRCTWSKEIGKAAAGRPMVRSRHARGPNHRKQLVADFPDRRG